MRWLDGIANSMDTNLSKLQEIGLPRWLVVKNPPANSGHTGSIPRLGRSPGEGHGNPLQYSCLENPHGQRSLGGSSPEGCTESDMTEMT